MDLRAMLALAERVVDEAEAMFVAGLGADPAEFKGPGDFATEVDLEIESSVRALLEDTDIPVYGEEAGGAYSSDAVWVVDPIDGTSNYAAGNPMCAILLSLLVEDQPVLAVTSLPLLHRRLTVVSGGPLMVNGREAPALTRRHRMVTQVGFSSVSSRSRSPFTSDERLEMLGILAAGSLRPRITGSVGADLALTAQGIFDGAISFSPYVWDNAAGVALVRAAGGVVTDIDGRDWTPDSTGVVAGTPEVHAELMSTINTVRNS